MDDKVLRTKGWKGEENGLVEGVSLIFDPASDKSPEHQQASTTALQHKLNEIQAHILHFFNISIDKMISVGESNSVSHHCKNMKFNLWNI